MASNESASPETPNKASNESPMPETTKTVSIGSASPEIPNKASNEPPMPETTKALSIEYSARPATTKRAMSSESARPEASNNTTGSEENRPGSSRQRKRKTSRNDPGVPKKPQRGMGVAQLERLRLQESLSGGESLDVQNNLQPPLPPFYMQQGGPAGYVGYPPINAGYFIGYPTVGGYPNQQALMSPYSFYPVDYAGVHPGNTAELSSMPKPASSSQGFYPMNCTSGGPSGGTELFLGNPAFSGSQFHGHTEENSNSQAPGNETSGQAPDGPSVINLEEGEGAESKDKEGDSSETKEHEFFSTRRTDYSSSSSKALPGDVLSEASPEDTTIGKDDKDSSAVDLNLKL